MSIPFNRPFIAGKELYYIAQAVQSGHLAGDGAFTRNCHRWLEEHLGVRKVLLTHSCTAALEMAALLAEIEPGDEVIIPAFTFVSTANAFVLRGARIRFVDVRDDTLNLDEGKLEAAITPASRAVVPVHYAGVGCEMDAVMEIARRHSLLVIEDAAQGVGAYYKERPLGSIAPLAALSFHETKNYISGEGGALCINDDKFIERAEIVREKGTNRSRFFRGQVDKYTWVDIGSSFLPSELIAAFLYAQLEESESISERRMAIFNRYADAFKTFAQQGRVRPPYVPPHCRHNAHMFYLILESESVRDRLIAHLREEGILAVFHYLPLHLSPMGLKWRAGEGSLPVTESISRRLVRLPFYYDLDPADQDRVVEAVVNFLRL
ncbi:MAG: dTDP-4-amino-4,6-dideoxygalactose transaminase [Calditrichaeota bacterium]|nr:dTDP-4-amino-4,6-dideoxygalactose transaminase [Calditrichota bacterium]